MLVTVHSGPRGRCGRSNPGDPSCGRPTAVYKVVHQEQHGFASSQPPESITGAGAECHGPRCYSDVRGGLPQDWGGMQGLCLRHDGARGRAAMCFQKFGWHPANFTGRNNCSHPVSSSAASSPAPRTLSSSTCGYSGQCAVPLCVYLSVCLSLVFLSVCLCVPLCCRYIVRGRCLPTRGNPSSLHLSPGAT